MGQKRIIRSRVKKVGMIKLIDQKIESKSSKIKREQLESVQNQKEN